MVAGKIRMDVGSQPRQKRRKEERGVMLARAEEDAISAVEAEGGFAPSLPPPIFNA